MDGFDILADDFFLCDVSCISLLIKCSFYSLLKTQKQAVQVAP